MKYINENNRKRFDFVKLTFVGGYIVFLGLISIFVVVYLVCFYMWLRVLISRRVAIYSDGYNIIIIMAFFWGGG